MRKTSIALTLIVLLFPMSIRSSAQDGKGHEDRMSSPPASPASTVASALVEKPVAENERLTFRDRLTEYRQSTFQPTALVFPAIVAGYDQMTNYPSEWRQGGEGYGKRMASAYGGVVLDNTISFGIASLDREDPRYVRSTYPKTAIFRRAGYAITHTFVSHREGKQHMFAWSRLAGAYGAGFVVNEWYPQRRSTVHNAVYLGSFNLASDLGFNILREFIRPHFVFGPGKDKRATP